MRNTRPGSISLKFTGDVCCRYVKAVSKIGVFVTLARGLDARIRLSQLADSFVDDPQAAFPEGKLVKGRIVSTEPTK